jgi:hypothetical protein
LNLRKRSGFRKAGIQLFETRFSCGCSDRADQNTIVKLSVAPQQSGMSALEKLPTSCMLVDDAEGAK